MSGSEQRPSTDHIQARTLPYPARPSDMRRQPARELSNDRPAGELRGKVALVTGAASGIGLDVAIAYAMAGAEVAIVYAANDNDDATTRSMVNEVDHFGLEVALACFGQAEHPAPACVLPGSCHASFMTGAPVEATGGKLSGG